MDPSRITLRRFQLSDAGDFFRWSSDERVACKLRWDPIKSKEEALKYLQNDVVPHPWHHSICLDDRFIGYVAVWRANSPWEPHKANIGYAVSADYWGRGIATVALRKGVRKVFEDLPDLVRLEAFTVPENVGSQRVLEKVGFVKEGFLRKNFVVQGEVHDYFVFSFLSSDKIL